LNDRNRDPRAPRIPTQEEMIEQAARAANDAPPPITLVLTLDPMSGQVHLSGPLQNRMLCYGMMELAKDALRTLAERGVGEQGEGKRIVVPR
jgi:hypothetical protein